MAKLYFHYSAMDTGKSTVLLQVAHNYEADLGPDLRVTSRLGVSRPAEPVAPDTDLEATILAKIRATIRNNVDVLLLADNRELGCVLVYEAQFLTPLQVIALHRFAHAFGVPVICYGLRTNFCGEPFPGAATLFARADSLEELKTLCSCCKRRKATMNPQIDEQGRRVQEGPQIGIEGPISRYEPQCAACFYHTGP